MKQRQEATSADSHCLRSRLVTRLEAQVAAGRGTVETIRYEIQRAKESSFMVYEEEDSSRRHGLVVQGLQGQSVLY